MDNRPISNLKLPAIVAPMFRVSGPDLVIAACRSGVIGSFPAINPRTTEELDHWLTQISTALEHTLNPAPYAVNIVIRSEKLSEELDVVKRHKVPIVITSVGSPEQVVPHIHSYGGLVLSDVATLRHAQKAVELGVDGLILLCAGAGGNTGWLNPFAFVRAVREFFDGIVVVAGCIMDGASIRAAEALGADMVYMGTRFISANESMAVDEYKLKLLASNIDDVMTTNKISGMPANFIRSTIEAAGLDPKNLPPYEEFNKGDIRKQRWKNIWSAGQGVGAVKEVLPTVQIVEQLYLEYTVSEKQRKTL
ncbi:NAD(P)H-dependent flavin oxidoreductase [Neobacillus rhizophilus]|uniref:Probable nitronate monooxygenase n=1 Tax=Neobacillus rhizophilus TaxID=2833579 RepID=A0A942UBL9_9BACI|nr:nitronate monooxygenase [Neobacillus rhizophilus]MBS4215194.1 nitronate monooxygenase [Neobacillus rhizophilus]